MINVTNVSKGFRGITTASDGIVTLAPGESRDLDVPESERDAPTDWFAFAEVGEKADGPKPDIASAIELLDPANDEHWTNAGLPSVDAVSAIIGDRVTRADINAVAPEFMRPGE